MLCDITIIIICLFSNSILELYHSIILHYIMTKLPNMKKNRIIRSGNKNNKLHDLIFSCWQSKLISMKKLIND